MKTVVRMCFVQTLQRVKVNRCLESNEDSMNARPEGKTKFLSILPPARLLQLREESHHSALRRGFIRVSIPAHSFSRRKILQRNGTQTTWTGIDAGGSCESASKFVPGLSKPRLT